MYGGDKRLRSFAGAQAASSMTTAFVERRRGQVPLNFDEGRDQREEVCDESRSKHPEDRLEGKSLGFSEKRRESCGGPELIDSSPMMAFEERHLGRDRFYIIPISLAIRFPEKSFIIQLNSAHTDNNITLSNGYGIVLYPIDCSSIRKNRMCDR